MNANTITETELVDKADEAAADEALGARPLELSDREWPLVQEDRREQELLRKRALPWAGVFPQMNERAEIADWDNVVQLFRARASDNG
jgi:hypothetical protein